MWKSLGKSYSDCLPSRTKVVANDESLYNNNNKACDVCVEESKVCNCNDVVLREKDGVEHHHKGGASNSSFLHAVINMVGMLIGT